MATVLVVEDVAANRVLVTKLLRASGHEVLGAEDVPSSLEMAREHRPDVILMDLSLPHVDGWEGLRRIRDDPELAACPVVAVTAHAMANDRERALAAGFDGYLTKPIDVSTFVNSVLEFVR